MECITKQIALRTCCNRLNYVTINLTNKSLNRKLMKEHKIRKHLINTDSLIYDLKVKLTFIFCVFHDY